MGKNGDARAWIENSKVLIHTGCSTAIQAAIADKPVINYVPIESGAFEMSLPNSIGYKARTIDELCSLIEKNSLSPASITPEVEMLFDQKDSFNFIVEDLGEPELNLNTRISNMMIFKIRFVSCFDSIFRKIFRKIMGKKVNSFYDLTFDYNYFNQFSRLVKDFDQEKNIKINKIGRDMFLVCKK